jgi:hypothetical protein
MDRIIFSLEQDAPGNGIGDLGDLGQSFDLIIEPMTSDASPDNYADYSVRGALGIQLVQAGDGRLQVYRIKGGGLFYTALRDMTGYKSLSNRVLEGEPRLTITRVRLFRGSDMLFDYHNVNGGLSAATLRYLLMTFAPHFIPDVIGTSADFVTSPPAATDGRVQNLALAAAALFGGGGASSVTQGHGPSRAISGDLNPTMGTTLPEFATLRHEHEGLVRNSDEFVAPGDPEWVWMQSTPGTEGLNPDIAPDLVDDDGKFMIGVSDLDLGYRPDQATQDAKMYQRKEDMRVFGSELGRIAGKVYMQVKKEAKLYDPDDFMSMSTLGLTERGITRAAAEALIPRWNARTNRIISRGGRAKAREQAGSKQDSGRATEGVLDIDDSDVVRAAVDKLLKDGWLTSKTDYDAKKGTLGTLRFAND